MSFDINFYRGKKVFVTGHTGFKGSWLCKILSNAGAQVTGYSLEPPTNPSLFEIAGIENDVVSVIGDIRDLKSLKAAGVSVKLYAVEPEYHRTLRGAVSYLLLKELDILSFALCIDINIRALVGDSALYAKALRRD